MVPNMAMTLQKIPKILDQTRKTSMLLKIAKTQKNAWRSAWTTKSPFYPWIKSTNTSKIGKPAWNKRYAQQLTEVIVYFGQGCLDGWFCKFSWWLLLAAYAAVLAICARSAGHVFVLNLKKNNQSRIFQRLNSQTLRISNRKIRKWLKFKLHKYKWFLFPQQEQLTRNRNKLSQIEIKNTPPRI